MAVELLAGEERAELRARVDRDIAELDELIGELLLASRLDALEQPVRNEEVDLLALVAEEAARAKAEVSGTPERVTGDSRMLRRLVRNLLENARRYGGGSRIDASVGTAAGGKVRLCIADRGPGVPEQECERIFEPFYRAPGMRESDDGGVGLGLALVRQIAQHHGGEARCLSREGGGTLFEILLPAAKPAAGTC
jgi:signal transduction histidine kinase